MSGAPKRSHEDTLHLSSKHPHEDPGTHSKLVSSASNEYHMPYDISQDSRAAKAPRFESDRRSPLHSVYRIPSSSNDSHASHPVGTENKIESRDSKDNRDLRFEIRDSKTEKKDSHVEARRDSQGAKSEKDLRVEDRGDDNKDVRYDRDIHNDSKGDKMEKDGYGLVSSHLNWKESKEYHRGKRYSDAPLDTWHMQRGNAQGPLDARKESSTAEEREYVDAHEAVGENKVDSRVDDRSKEKDRKRKDVKHRDWGERDKERNERRNSAQVSNTTGDIKESVKEDRDIERLEKEKKDHPKERENLKERENDQSKKDSLHGMDKHFPNNEKELGGGSVKLPEQDIVLLEQKKQKDADSSKMVDHEAKEKRKERDADLEGHMPDKRNRSCDKESDDGCADGEGAIKEKDKEKEKEKEKENEREPCNLVGQHRRRVQRSRGSPQVPNRERSSAQDTDGSQGKVEVSSVVYKVGESMQDLIKLWEEYEASQSQVEKNCESSNKGPTLVIRVPSEYVTATNRQDALRHQYPYSANYLVRGGQLWGTDVYTYDSDLVAVLMHMGYCRPTASPPPSAIQELRATIRVLPPQDCYISTLRNNVRSRAWGSRVGCSYRIERCRMVKKGGGTVDLEPCLTTPAMEPTLAPVAVERTITTRAAASNALRQQRFVREITIQYNLCNEPWIKYSVSIVADKGLKKPLYTSARLKKGEVLYLETHFYRYELCFAGEKMVKATPATQSHDTEKSQNHHHHSANGEKNDRDNVMIDAFRWSRCKKPLPQKVMRMVGIPLPLEHVEVLEENLDWEDVQWSQTGVWIAGKEYTLARVHFLSTN